MEYFKSLRLHALKSILDPDLEAQIRHIFRWYSHQFHTPLHEVADLPQEDVLEAFYEAEYEAMSEDERQREVDELLETDDERRARMKARDWERYEAFQFARFSFEQEKRSEAKKSLAELKSAKDRKSLLNFPRPPDKTMAPASHLPSGDPGKGEDEVRMSFVTSESFEEALAEGGMIAPERKR